MITEINENAELALNQVPSLEQELKRQIKGNPLYFNRFGDFPYDDWKPARQRVEFANKYAKGNSLLDIGCGYYPVTSEIRMKRKVGLDVSVKAALKSEKEFHEFYFLDIANTGKEVLKENLGTFDTVVAAELLEHLENPADVIEKIEHLLNPNGRALVTLPNGGSIAGIVDKMRNNGKYNRFKLYHRTHISLLKIKEWERLFKRAGLDVYLFDFRPSDIVEGFPSETMPGWKAFCSLFPDFLAHQFYFVIEKPNNGRLGGGK